MLQSRARSKLKGRALKHRMPTNGQRARGKGKGKAAGQGQGQGAGSVGLVVEAVGPQLVLDPH